MCKFLKDPADEDEKLCWDKELLTLDDLPDDVDAIPDDFEDPRGFYAVLGCSRVSTHAEIKAAYDREKRSFKMDSLKTHPDKNPDNPDAKEEFLKVRDRWDAVGLAYCVLGSEFGYFHDCYKYDKDGDHIRFAFQQQAFETVYSGQTFKQHADKLREKEQRRERYGRMRETRKNRAEEGGTGEFVSLLVLHIMYLSRLRN